ncbi:MAG: hypothetical protein IPJ65_41405 [Archangiaceae bacterium]|nr:hypothetical protein [Archangiaceae bacterium]
MASPTKVQGQPFNAKSYRNSKGTQLTANALSVGSKKGPNPYRQLLTDREYAALNEQLKGVTDGATRTRYESAYLRAVSNDVRRPSQRPIAQLFNHEPTTSEADRRKVVQTVVSEQVNQTLRESRSYAAAHPGVDLSRQERALSQLSARLSAQVAATGELKAKDLDALERAQAAIHTRIDGKLTAAAQPLAKVGAAPERP